MGDQSGNRTQHITEEREFNGNQEESKSRSRGRQISHRKIGKPGEPFKRYVQRYFDNSGLAWKTRTSPLVTAYEKHCELVSWPFSVLSESERENQTHILKLTSPGPCRRLAAGRQPGSSRQSAGEPRF